MGRRTLIRLIAVLGTLLMPSVALSCEDCKAAVSSALHEWKIVVPGLIADLPGAVCSRCPVSSSCEALIVSGIEAFSAGINRTNESAVCDRLGLCNVTMMIA